MLLGFNLPIHFLFVSLTVAASQRGWTNGPKATGMKDPNVAVGCSYWANNVQSSDTCQSVVDFFGTTQKQLVSWNPSLLPDYCVLVPGWSYCVSAPATATTPASSSATPAGTLTYSGAAAPTQSGLTESCTKYHLVENGDTCNTIQDQYMTFTLSQFYAWNPGCKGLETGFYVCVAAKVSPSSSGSSTISSSFPTQTGVAPNCNKWHFVSGDDDCNSIRSKYGLTPAQFYDLNPATGPKCTNLWRQTNVCVGATGTTPSAQTTAPETTATNSSKPSSA